ncbi:hypothetical protein K437DRAFT_256662 [Tilletiaria anomala UBC 951]|uniref:Chitin synthase export chaperone n=1 Tax=Tilletiaria anomala (strain ATCC 24038 / CBS 436.72 / UBC 951) TaxID=1037660 RepID=A0A066VU14_TILAU|nr:uncharacterized protein K437DRAFT_256662 [Tilletiaria anomala UBC 951]KDN45217.1 hypothetical protein K437DRAFT_256662 [Tilletiaria anomala UBC 951]
MGMSFGSYTEVCNTVALVVCPLLGTSMGLEPICYSRNVEINSTVIFQPATCVIHIAALVMTAVMVYHIRSKYTAVGRKEIVLFFYLYAVSEILAIFLDSAIIPTYSGAYSWFSAIYVGLNTAIFWCLLVNGFVGFQFAEDGTPMSLWSLRISSLVVFLVTAFVAIATFKGIAGMSPKSQMGLFIVQFLFPIICVAVYVLSQIVLVLRTLDDRWPLGDIIFGVGFYVAGLVLMFAFSADICNGVKHYIDGTFFGVLCMLLSVMMVYKYWDSITKEDLEFSVGSKINVWEVKDPLLGSDADMVASSTSHSGGKGSFSAY